MATTRHRHIPRLQNGVKLWGTYEVRNMVGRGSCNEVYAATVIGEDDAWVALKVARRSVPGAEAMLVTEAKTTQALSEMSDPVCAFKGFRSVQEPTPMIAARRSGRSQDTSSYMVLVLSLHGQRYV